MALLAYTLTSVNRHAWLRLLGVFNITVRSCLESLRTAERFGPISRETAQEYACERMNHVNQEYAERVNT
jgi:hypothetical protein